MLNQYGYFGRANPGYEPESPPETVAELVSESASENGDPVYGYSELKEMDIHNLRRMAADANTTEIHGKSTRLEILSYFAADSR